MNSRKDNYRKPEIIRLLREQGKDGIDIPNASRHAMEMFRAENFEDIKFLFVRLVNELENYDKQQVDSFRQSLASAFIGANETRAEAIKQAIETFTASSSRDKFENLMHAIQKIATSVNAQAVHARTELRKKLSDDWTKKTTDFAKINSLTPLEHRILSPLTALYTLAMSTTFNDAERFSDESINRFHESLLEFIKPFYKKLIKLTREINDLFNTTEANFQESLQNDLRELLKNSIYVNINADQQISLDVSSLLKNLNALQDKVYSVSLEKNRKSEQQAVIAAITAFAQLISENADTFQKNINPSNTYQHTNYRNKKNNDNNKITKFASFNLMGKTKTKTITSSLKAISLDSGISNNFNPQTTSQTGTITSIQTTITTTASESSTTKIPTPKGELRISFSLETKSEDEDSSASSSVTKFKEPPPLRRSPAVLNLWDGAKSKKALTSSASSSNPDADDISDDSPENPTNTRP